MPTYSYEELQEQYERGLYTSSSFGTEQRFGTSAVVVSSPEAVRAARKTVVRETGIGGGPPPQPVVANTKAVRDKGGKHVEIAEAAGVRSKGASFDLPRI